MNETTIPEGLPDWIANHVRLYFENPEQGHDWDSTAVGGPGVLPALLLFTTGRKSGLQSILPLIYGRAGDALVLIASKGGAPKHPAWYLNLEANPNIEVQVKADRFPVTARTAEGEEREVMWRQMAEIYPPYDEYQVAAGDRQIPVVVLEPVS